MHKQEFKNIEDFLGSESFQKWVKNESGSHLDFWEKWMSENPDKKELVEQASLILGGLPFEFQEHSVDSSLIETEWTKLKQKTSKLDLKSSSASEAKVKRLFKIPQWGTRAAASVIILLGLGFLIQNYILNPLIVHQTPFGEQLSIVLPDSTVLELNANSKLSYREKNPRKVWLDGEAFFHVKKKPATGANFLVLTNDLTVEVLGTSFNVNAKESKTEVVLEEGSVKLNLNRGFEPELFMKPGEMVAFSAQNDKKAVKRAVKPKIHTSWKDGILEFDDVPLTEVMKRIEDIYGWRAVYQNEELKTRKISMPLPSNDLESALLILDKLGKAINIEIDKDSVNKVMLLR